ncbi:MAG: hypothetical protein J7K61_02015 [Thermoplasmata archaeon]|nr:hypothetical protein [Thermoplasmata archaeon]
MKKKTIEARKCEICGKIFKPTRTWQKYCSVECRNEAKRRRAIKWYETNKEDGILSKASLQDLIEKPPYSYKTRKILWAFKLAKDEIIYIENNNIISEKSKIKYLESQGIEKVKGEEYPALSFSALKRFTDLPDYILDRYLKKLCALGVLYKLEHSKYK